MLALLAVATGLRFVNLEQSPPGFYIDEAAISAQVICVRESGESLQRQRLPLLAPVLGGGYITPTYLYPAVAWTAMFGDSVTAFRGYTAFFSVLFIAGSFFLALRVWGTDEAAYLAATAAAISPWCFQFARIAWDPALAPAFTVWAFVFFWGRREWEFALSGVLFALAAYVYPPLRVQLAIMLPFALAGLMFVRKRPARPYMWTILAALVVAAPLLVKTATGEIQGRFDALSVFNHAWQQTTYGATGPLIGVQALFENIALLLSPKFLFVSGDANLRHSTGSFGVWSYLDFVAILGIIALAIARRERAREWWFEISFCIVGYLAGILPAAMTWESNPHALRSIGALTFLVLGVGGALGALWRNSRSMRASIVGIAVVSFALFVHVYFVTYPPIARVWFDADVKETALRVPLRDLPMILRSQGVNYDPMGLAYYQLSSGLMSCGQKSAGN